MRFRLSRYLTLQQCVVALTSHDGGTKPQKDVTEVAVVVDSFHTLLDD